MVNFLRYCCIKCSVICCISWIFWPAEAKTITQVVGSRVTLNCRNVSISNFNMAIWRMNGKHLFTFINSGNKSVSNESVRLNIKMSELGSQLIIEDAQKLHEGNYTCTMILSLGVFDEKWELLITEGNISTDKLKIAAIAAVPSACFLILVSVLAILTIRKQKSKNRSPSEIRQQKPVEDIYENHLEIQRRQAYLNKP